MDDTPLYKKPWFYIAGWLVFLLVVYGWQIIRMGGFVASELDILIDLACIFPLLLILWMAFFAQFVLPVRTFVDRQKIFDRLITYLFGGHGPAMFIRDGVLIKSEGEERKKGPGVLWLDSASAAVTRTATAIKQTMGPGVHFIESGEFIAGTIDLHDQSQSVGPKESDMPFEKKKDDQSEDDYNQIQDRRKQVSALTRDGIEIVPNISVTFRVATDRAKDNQPGSRFGFRTGITKKNREHEKQDQEAIRKAILGEGINPNYEVGSPRHRIAWNRLPALLAIDVWREYVSKFTLDELFKPEQLVPPAPVPAPQPSEEEVDLLSQPVQVSSNQETLQNAYASVLHFINVQMDRAIKRLEGKESPSTQKPATPARSSTPAPSGTKAEAQKKTALQVINDMVKARLTQAEVDILDDTGNRGKGTISSPEFRMLQERGLKVQSVGISNPRVHPSINSEITRHWEATWLINARKEKEQIERKRTIIEATAQEHALREYAEFLSRGLAKEKTSKVKDTLRVLLMRSRLIIIKNDKLRRLMGAEREEIEDILQWIENGS